VSRFLAIIELLAHFQNSLSGKIQRRLYADFSGTSEMILGYALGILAACRGFACVPSNFMPKGFKRIPKGICAYTSVSPQERRCKPTPVGTESGESST
jgi:hypothetical protein